MSAAYTLVAVGYGEGGSCSPLHAQQHESLLHPDSILNSITCLCKRSLQSTQLRVFCEGVLWRRAVGCSDVGGAAQVVGTRGDVQPFIAISRELRRYGHRVRLATHAVYRQFVEANGVEFFPLGGDPAVLSEFVVRNRGILPGGGSKTMLQDIREQARLRCRHGDAVRLCTVACVSEAA